ncbi:hypothetical protein L1887_52636 [Cichorium endivia]|nr:hypothetical protein L1887_52636 [Cichorium endivia]
MDRNPPSPRASSPLASGSDASPRFPIARLDVDRAEWKSKTIGRTFGSDARTPQDSTDSPSSSTPSTPTTPLPASRTYHSLNYAPRQRNSVLRPSAAAIFQSHSAQLAAGAQPSQTPTSPSQPLPNLMLTPRANAHAAPLTATSHLSTSPSYPTISLPDAPPRESSRTAANEHETSQRAAVARMQLQQMHDNARRLGLNNKSAGWLILEALQAATDGEWAAVAELIANGDATILLPRDPPSVFTSASQLSASFAYDHTIFNAASTSAPRPSPASLSESAETPILTLSGLRGRLARSSPAESAPGSASSDADAAAATLSLQSFVVKAHGSVSSLKDANARQETLESLAPLPHATEPSGARCAYPRFTLAAANAAFPLPPPLQPRAVPNDANAAAKSRARSNSKLNVAGSRASASFASIFGGSGRERRRQAAADEVAGSEMVDAQKLGGTSESSDAEPEAQQSSLGLGLRDAAAEGEGKDAEDAGGAGKAARRTISVWVVDHLVRRSAVMRTIRKTLEARIRTRLAAAGGGRIDRPSGGELCGDVPSSRAHARRRTSSVRDQLHAQDAATAEGQLEAVETVLCEEVYDRIFRPVASRDGYHDDALASRIAALNVLGLSLRHLGLDDPALADDLERIVKQCGEELQRLDSEQARSPKDKLDVLVRAHKLTVDGVAALPAADADKGTSADLILPLLIYSIVASNPARLASHLLYIQRFRAECLVQGETAYCLVNVQAAVAFLENVDVADLGLDASQIGAHLRVGESTRGRTSVQGPEEALAMPARIRGRLTQEIGDLAGASNKVITGVMGSSLAAFSRMMGAAAGDAQRPANLRAVSTPTDYARADEQVKDMPATDDAAAKLSIGDRLASLSTRLGGSSLSSSPSSLSLGNGGKKEEGVSPRSVSRELPGPPPPSKPVHARTTSYLASHLGRMTSRAPEEAKPVPASLRSPYPALSRPPTPDRPLHVVLASTGSVASVKIPLIVEALLAHANVRVQVIATDNSLHFYDRTALTSDYTVASLAAENLAASRGVQTSGPRVHLWTNADEWTSFTRVGDAILHIELRRWADVVIVAPCSANTLAKLAGGLCDDLLTSFMRALAKGAQVVLCPAMNTLMWENPLTDMHLRTVKEVLGYEVKGPVEKRLACGDTGKGAMIEWSEIVALVADRFGLQKQQVTQDAA